MININRSFIKCTKIGKPEAGLRVKMLHVLIFFKVGIIIKCIISQHVFKASVITQGVIFSRLPADPNKSDMF